MLIGRGKGKLIFVGLESGGKSLLMTRYAVANLYRNRRWQRITGRKRPIITNLAISDTYQALADKLGVEIKRWQHLAELPSLTECDLYIDEMATYFDSRTYENLPLNLRLWLAQAEKLGVQIVGATQDFGQIDVSFRRLCKEVYYVQKIIGSPRPMKTAPPVKFIWGIFFKWELDPRTFDGDQYEMKSKSIIPSIFRLKKEDIKYFDTNQRVKLSDPPPLQKIVRICPEDGYKQVRYR